MPSSAARAARSSLDGWLLTSYKLCRAETCSGRSRRRTKGISAKLGVELEDEATVLGMCLLGRVLAMVEVAQILRINELDMWSLGSCGSRSWIWCVVRFRGTQGLAFESQTRKHIKATRTRDFMTCSRTRIRAAEPSLSES